MLLVFPFLLSLFSSPTLLPSLLPPAEAKQLSAKIEKESKEWAFSYQWTDVKKATHSAAFSLPLSAVQADIDTPLRFPKKEAADAQGDAVRAYAKTLPKGVSLKVKEKKDGSIQFSASGPSRKAVKKALKGAQAAAQKGLDDFLEKNGWARLSDGAIVPDHVEFVKKYAPVLKEAALQIGGDPSNQREFLRRLVSFAQNIPYEAGRNGQDKGYRLPLSVLAKNKGDCDSKTVLFLAMVRAVYPELPMAVVYVPGHAFAALGIPAIDGDQTIKEKGQTYVVVEPVGPAVIRLGEASPTSKKALRKHQERVLPIR